MQTSAPALETVDMLVKSASAAASAWARAVAPVLALPDAEYQAWCQRPEIAALSAEHKRRAAEADAAVFARAAHRSTRPIAGDDVT